jgi:glycerol-3-phosphate dehydrogenase
MADFDIAVIGGGIHGTGIARDAAGRDLKVILVEQNDLASGTSSASTKLVHGGLRYLELGNIRLVRESLVERELLLRNAPHLVRQMRFVLPVQGDMRPPWLIRLGLAIYDLFAWRGSLPSAKRLDLNIDPAGSWLRRSFIAGFEYSDCVVDDARLVVLNAIDAAERGATVRTRTRCVRVERSDIWTLVLNARGRRVVVTARALVDATGPWTAQFSETVLRLKAPAPVRLVKGSHIVVPQLFDHDRAYLFQNADRRIVFAIPYQRHFTLIGTTDMDFRGDLDALSPEGDEIQYLCDAVNAYFRDTVSSGDVVWAFSGVRSLYEDRTRKAQDVSRDHVLQLDTGFRRAPMLSVFGGKLTTYRRVAEEAVDKLAQFFTPGPRWTAKSALPGGDLGGRTFGKFVAEVRTRWPFLPAPLSTRLMAAYGSRVDRILGDARQLEDLGPMLGADLTAAEVRHLMRHEWAETLDDVLWRRTKLGLQFSTREREALSHFMASATGMK